MLDLLPELCDAYPEQVRVLPPRFNRFGGRRIFGGQVVTVRCLEDNSLVREAVAKPGAGKVLVVDGGGMSRRALLGDLLAQKALDNGWGGIVVYGYVRDVTAISQMDIGVMALGAMPMKTDKKGLGERDVAVAIDGTVILPGEYIYGDENGLLVAAESLPLAQQVLTRCNS